jgi:hypothetical protein
VAGRDASSIFREDMPPPRRLPRNLRRWLLACRAHAKQSASTRSDGNSVCTRGCGAEPGVHVQKNWPAWHPNGGTRATRVGERTRDKGRLIHARTQ